MYQEGSRVNLTSSGLSDGNVKSIESVSLLLIDTRSDPVCIAESLSLGKKSQT